MEYDFEKLSLEQSYPISPYIENGDDDFSICINSYLEYIFNCIWCLAMCIDEKIKRFSQICKDCVPLTDALYMFE